MPVLEKNAGVFVLDEGVVDFIFADFLFFGFLIFAFAFFLDCPRCVFLNFFVFVQKAFSLTFL